MSRSHKGIEYLLYRAASDSRIESLLLEIQRLIECGDHPRADQCERTLDDLVFGYDGDNRPLYAPRDVRHAAARLYAKRWCRGGAMTEAEITAAASLRELCDALNAPRDGLDLDRILSDLPTFGGTEPEDTHGIFSWDDRNLLIQGEDGFKLMAREDL